MLRARDDHMLDWGIPGLLDTLQALDQAGIKHAGAGRNLQEAQAPAILEAGEGGRVILFSLGSVVEWYSGPMVGPRGSAGCNVIETRGRSGSFHCKGDWRGIQTQGDIVVVSIHWGGNWGYKIPPSRSARPSARRRSWGRYCSRPFFAPCQSNRSLQGAPHSLWLR